MRILIILVVGILLVAPQPAIASVDYFLKIDGIDGESTVAGREGQIEIQSFSWGSSRTCDHRGQAAFKSLVLLKNLDKSSPYLAKALADGLISPMGRLEAVSAGPDGQPRIRLQYKFNTVLITEYDPFSDAGDSLPKEKLGVCFEGLRITYFLYDKSGALVEVITQGFPISFDGKVPPPDEFPGVAVRIIDTISITGPSESNEELAEAAEALD